MIVIFFLFLAVLTVGLLFLSGQMTDLLYTEKDLVTSLKDYIKAEESKLERLKQ